MNTNKEWNPALTMQRFDNAPFSVFSPNSKVSGWIILYNNLGLTCSGEDNRVWNIQLNALKPSYLDAAVGLADKLKEDFLRRAQHQVS